MLYMYEKGVNRVQTKEKQCSMKPCTSKMDGVKIGVSSIVNHSNAIMTPTKPVHKLASSLPTSFLE